MKVKGILLAGILAAVLLGACSVEQPVTDSVQNSGVTQGIEKEEKGQGQVTFAPTVTEEPEAKESEDTSEPETSKTPEAASKPEVTVPSEETLKLTATVTPEPTATPVPTVSPKQTELAEHLRTAHKDEASAKIVEKGYWYEVGETCSDGIFTFDFKAVTGDMQNPMLVIDVTVADESLVVAYDKLKLHVYTLGENAFNNDRDGYLPCNGYGIRDEKTENLYHVTLPGSGAWMADGRPFVADICRVEFEPRNNNPLVYEIEVPEWKLFVPKHKFYPVLEKGYEGLSFTHNGREYWVDMVDYGQYTTLLTFFTYADRDEVLAYPGGAERFSERVRPEWFDFADYLELEADGEIFRVQSSGFAAFSDYSDRTGELRGEGIAWFSGIDFSEASEITLWLGTEGYDLKSGDKKLLHRELAAPAIEAEQKELGAHLRVLHEDEISATIVEKGYYYAVNESRIDDIFRFDLKAITGDVYDPKLVFDVTVEDEVLTEMYDTIHLYVGCFSEADYDPEEERGWNRIGYGIRDKENRNVYHVTMSGAMLGYGPTVINVYRVGFDVDRDDSNGVLWYEVEPEEYSVDVPKENLHPAHEVYYSDVVFTHNGREYAPRFGHMGAYQTDFTFYTDIDATEVPEEEYELLSYREALQEEWLAFAMTLRLVVDGKEYTVIDEDGKRGYFWFSIEEGASSYVGNACPYFPPIDFLKANVIEMKSGNAVHRLK